MTTVLTCHFLPVKTTDGRDVNTITSDREPVVPNMVTIISPEGESGEGFALVSNSESAAHINLQDTSDAASTEDHSSGHNSSPSPQNTVHVEPDPSELGASQIAAKLDSHVTESGYVDSMQTLSLSEKENKSRLNEGPSTGTITSTMDDAGESSKTILVPAVFVFGGMDTQDTVHGDSFVLSLIHI